MYHDIRGLSQTAASSEAQAAFDATVEAYLRFELATGDRLKETLDLDPQMPMAHCLKGCFMLLFAKRGLAAKAAEALAAARTAGAAVGLTTREDQHLGALAAWLAGDFHRAAAAYDAILLDHPQDIMAMKLAHYLHFYCGDAAAMRASLARPGYAWDDTVPGYGFVLGMTAFAAEESGDYAAAEAIGRAAVERNPADIWAAHAVAHVMEMQDRPSEGALWIDDLESSWAGCNNFAYHVYWHRCLFLLDQGRVEDVLRDYDEKVRADLSEEYLDISNAVALLWRLQQRGIDVGGRWQELADKSTSLGRDHMLVFADMHYLMALAASGRRAEAEAMLESLSRFAGGAATQEAVARDIGVPLGRAILAYYQDDCGAAVDHLLAARAHQRRLGGSHAQRDLFDQFLIDAAVKAGRKPVAQALLSERAATRRSNDWNREMTAQTATLAAT